MSLCNYDIAQGQGWLGGLNITKKTGITDERSLDVVQPKYFEQHILDYTLEVMYVRILFVCQAQGTKISCLPKGAYGFEMLPQKVRF